MSSYILKVSWFWWHACDILWTGSAGDSRHSPPHHGLALVRVIVGGRCHQCSWQILWNSSSPDQSLTAVWVGDKKKRSGRTLHWNQTTQKKTDVMCWYITMWLESLCHSSKFLITEVISTNEQLNRRTGIVDPEVLDHKQSPRRTFRV